MTLRSHILNRLKKRDILLMTHVVLGYPSMDDSPRIVDAMVDSGVDLMELQIPFQDPDADGPVIAGANRTALEKGATVEACLDLAGRMVEEFDIPFVAVTYHGLMEACGMTNFIQALAGAGLKGAIVCDQPSRGRGAYVEEMERWGLAPIPVLSPGMSEQRMRYLASPGEGFIYCKAREGLTGGPTRFSNGLATYLRRCRKASPLPLALGFGVRNGAHVDFLKGLAHIAVIGTETIRVVEREGIPGVQRFIRGLR